MDDNTNNSMDANNSTLGDMRKILAKFIDIRKIRWQVNTRLVFSPEAFHRNLIKTIYVTIFKQIIT